MLSRHCISCFETSTSVLTTGRSSRQTALISASPTVHQVAVAASSVVVTVVVAAVAVVVVVVVVADRLCR